MLLIRKYEVINEFLSYAIAELPGAIISADVFGIICEVRKTLKISDNTWSLLVKILIIYLPWFILHIMPFGQIVNKLLSRSLT